MKSGNFDISIIVLLIGRYEALCDEFVSLVEEMKLLSHVKTIFVSGNKAWSSAPLFQMLPIILENATILSLDDNEESPTILLEKCLAYAQSEYLMIAYPLGSSPNARYKLFSDAIDKVKNSSPVTFCIRNDSDIPPYIYANNGNIFGFCQCSDIFQLDDLCFSREYLMSCCPLDNTYLLRDRFEKWLSLLLFRGTEMIYVGSMKRTGIPMCSYPFRTKRYYGDISLRYALYSTAPSKPVNRNWKNVYESFIHDIPFHEAQMLSCDISNNSLQISPRYKIMLIGGWWEYHHNQICFQNYFEFLQGSGFCTFRTAFETLICPSELIDYDLVIFSRCRSDEAIKLIQFCNDRNIRTMYMIDDNWLSFAADFPDIGGSFVPGNPNYDNFIHAIELVDVVWLFNSYLEEDIKKYCKRIIRFKISILPYYYHLENKQERSDDQIYVGYAGSLRWSNSIFEALARVARQNKRVKIVLLGVLSKEQLELFNDIDIVHMPFISYGRYTELMGKLSPDLMLAPLTDSRTNRSKCYNKYIEFGVVGAAGIFSHLEPYTSVVHEGVNGYFVNSDDADSWYQKLVSVLNDVPGLRKVQRQAQEDVLTNHSVKNLIDEFCHLVSSVINSKERTS